MTQAILKRGLPRALLTDNGAAMVSEEFVSGLERVAIQHERTLPYSPQQNAKQEVFWAQVEGRLMAMLEGEKELTLDFLNRATQAWVELEYHHRVHSELKMTPLKRLVEGKSVGRPSRSAEELRRAFRREVLRTQRRSDGTITVEGKRYEIPAQYAPIRRPTVRYATWDLTTVEMIEPRTGASLATLYPLDKVANSDGRRRALPTPPVDTQASVSPSGVAPLLRSLMERVEATGLPPAYLPATHGMPTSEEKVSS